MSKYPCGICKTGVKYQAIQCNGPCEQWHHSKCLNWSDKYFKNLTKQEIQLWKCDNCLITNSPRSPQNLRNITPSSLDFPNAKNETLNSSIKTLENSLIENNFLNNSTSEEDKLTMAATIGSALLDENTLLKKQLLSLECKLSDLQCKLISYEAKLEEMSEEEGKYLYKIETLSQELGNSQAQVEKERNNIVEVQQIFEDHDISQEQLIAAHVKKISDLEKQILLSDRNRLKQVDKAQLQKIDIETQTTDCESPQTTPQNLTTILMEIAQMKARQNNFDTVIKNFSSQSQCHCSNIPHKSALYEQSTQTETTPVQVDVPNSPSGVTYTPETIKKGPPSRNLFCSKPHGSNKRRKSAAGKKTNQFSVSLQVKKNKIYNEKIKTYVKRTVKNTLQNDNLVSDKQYGTFNISRFPPLSATILKENETYEEFLQKSTYCISEDTACNSPPLQTLPTPETNLPIQISPEMIQDGRATDTKTPRDQALTSTTSPAHMQTTRKPDFLELRQRKEERMRHQQKTRIFTNSSLRPTHL